MKVRFMLFLLAALFVAGSAFTNAEKSLKGVVLRGEVGRETGRSAIPPTIPIKAFIIDNNMVNIQFGAVLGTVEVFLDGVLEETVQVVISGQQTSFSVAHLAPGTYKLELKTLRGGYVYGDIVIEEE